METSTNKQGTKAKTVSSKASMERNDSGEDNNDGNVHQRDRVILTRWRKLTSRATKYNLTEGDLEKIALLPKRYRFLISLHPKSFMALKTVKLHWTTSPGLRSSFYAILVFLVTSITAVVLYRWLRDVSCLVPTVASEIVADLSYTALPCAFCVNLTQVSVHQNLTWQEFDKHYAYTGVPVVVKGAASHWKALDVFSFEFFRTLYMKHPALLERLKDCFLLKTPMKHDSLKEIINNLPDRQVAGEEGEQPWYIAWSHCFSESQKLLGDYYDIPDFIPPAEEHNAYVRPVEWIFMGNSADAAVFHIDHLPTATSWQAQIRGSKTWVLAPSPECQHVCHTLEVRLEPGDVIAVETGWWIHATNAHPGDISIGFGREYT